MIPQGWKKTTIDDLCDLINGHGFKSSEWDTVGLPIIRIQNLNGSRDFNYFSGEPKDRWLVSPSDLLFAWAGVKGVSFGPCLWNGPSGVLNQHIYKVISKGKTSNEFLHALLTATTERIEANSHGFKANFVHVKKGDIVDQIVSLPPLPEQQKIAAILSTWDRAIELTEKLIAATQKRKQALMQQLLTGKVRFAEFEKSKEVQQTPIGEMPADWTKVRLSQIFEKVKRKNAVGEQLVLTASGEFGLVDQREFFNRSVAGADLSKYYLLKRGEFAYNRSAMKGYPFGAIKRLDRYEQGVLSTLYGCFQLKGERCDSNYLCHFFEARLLDRQLRRITQVGGRAHGLLNIIDGDFYSMSLAIPSMDEQQRITAVLDAQEAENKGWRKTLDVLQQQKKGLMQQLLTGKVRVTTESAGGQGGPADE